MSKIKNQKENYIIGIYGVNAAGKSVTSKKLSNYFEVCEIQSTDSIMKIYKFTCKDNQIKKLSSRNAWSLFGDKNTENIIKGFKKYRSLIFDHINCLIQRVPTEKFTMILEGVHFDPAILELNPGLKIVPVLLIIQDVNSYKKRIVKKARGRISLQNELLTNVNTAKTIQKFLINEAKKKNILIIDTAENNLRQVIGKIIKKINDC